MSGIYKMNIIDFCNSNDIKWFPIILKNKEPISIKHPLYKRIKKDGNISYTPHYIEFKDIRDDVLEARQELLYTNEIYDFINDNSYKLKIALDTSKVFQIDIDTDSVDERILHNWVENENTKSAYYKSITKSYGYHIFIKVEGFHDFIKNYTQTKNRFQFKKNYVNGDGDVVEIFDDDKNGIELLTGQWGYANIDIDVFNKNITCIKKNDLPFFTDLLTTNKHFSKSEQKGNENEKDDENKIIDVINNKNRYDNQEIYDNMKNISQEYIDNRSHHFKIICSLLSAGYEGIARDCMYRSSNTKNKNLDIELENFKKSNNNSISIKTLFYYSKLSNENNYIGLLKKHRGVHLREEYKKQLFSLAHSNSIHSRYLPYSILENIDTTKNSIIHIKSHLGSGKTTIIKQFIKNNPSIKKILYFAPRILFARDIYNDLQDYDFKLYNKLKTHEYTTTDRIIIQLESLWKIGNQQFDLIVIDEIESVLKQLTSKITNKNIVKTYETFNYIINNCKTIITADAFLSNNSVEIINKIKPNCLSNVIVNTFNPYKRVAVEVAGFENLLEKAIQQVNKNERIVFITLIKNNGDHAYKEFQDRCPNKKIKYYYGSMNEKDKKFDNINEEWKDVDILIYTPIITCGVNYSFPTFHSLYMWISPNSCCVRDLFQASLRVRTLIKNDCYFAFNYVYNKYSKKSDIICKIFENSEGNILNIYKNLFEKQEYMIELGVAIPKMCDWGVINLANSIFEDYISNTHIVKTTHEYLRLCGYDIIPLETLPNGKDCDLNIMEKTSEFTYSSLDDITDIEYLCLERNVYELDEKDKCSMIKYKFNELLGVNDILFNELDDESKIHIEELYVKSINNFQQLKNILNELKNNHKSIQDSVNEINKEDQNNYSVYVDTNLISTDINSDIKQLFNCNSLLELSYTTDDVKNNMDKCVEIIEKAKKVYNFRNGDRGSKKNDFKYVNACIKHIIRNYLGLDLIGKRERVGKSLVYKYCIKDVSKVYTRLNNVSIDLDKINEDYL